MSDPSEPKPDPSEPLPGEAEAGKVPEPGPRWLEDHPYLRAFLDGLRRPSAPPDAQSKQISIFDMLLVMLIAAVVLGILGMLPNGYSISGATFGVIGGGLVLCIVRPRAAVTRLASWAMFGWMTAGWTIWLSPIRLPFSLMILFFILHFALGEEHPIVKRCRWILLVLPFLLIVLYESLAWVTLPSWLPLALYLVATGIGAWRLWRPAGGSSPPRSP